MTQLKKIALIVAKKLRESQAQRGRIQGIQRILEPVIEAESWDCLLLVISVVTGARPLYSTESPTPIY